MLLILAIKISLVIRQNLKLNYFIKMIYYGKLNYRNVNKRYSMELIDIIEKIKPDFENSSDIIIYEMIKNSSYIFQIPSMLNKI